MLKHQALELISEKINYCRKCDILCSYRAENNYKTVSGEGNPKARIMMIGEAPGQNEAETGRPFVGRAGKLLDILIKQVGWSRENVYITNFLKCRPPNNRDPSKEELNNCRPFLDLQIKVIKPDFIVCLGKVASLNLLKPKDANEYWFNQSVNSMRGKIHNYLGTKVICTFHPSFLLRNFSAEKFFLEDLRMVGFAPKYLK